MTETTQSTPKPPLISIITATYNASHVLRYAISSVLRSDFQDWELIVVGDHCTDDTENVVEQFGDQRIRFYNLSENSGQQATPTNFAFTKVRGNYIAFLNQDDLFLPNHLDNMLQEMRNTSADIVLSRFAIIYPFGDDADVSELKLRNGGHSPFKREFSPINLYIASSWLTTIDFVRRFGNLRLEQNMYTTPTQDWLFRAWKNGFRIHCTEDCTVLALLTGSRKDFYKSKSASEHSFVYKKIVLDPSNQDFIRDKLESQIRRLKRHELPLFELLQYYMRSTYHFFLMTISNVFGTHPYNLPTMIRYKGKGGLIRRYKKRTGLDSAQR